MPKCKNDPKTSYTGKEPSPKGLGYCAKKERIGSKKRGKDKKMWIVKKRADGVKLWTRFSSKKKITKKRKYMMKGGGVEINVNKYNNSETFFINVTQPMEKRGTFEASSAKTKFIKGVIESIRVHGPSSEIFYTPIDKTGEISRDAIQFDFIERKLVYVDRWFNTEGVIMNENEEVIIFPQEGDAIDLATASQGNKLTHTQIKAILLSEKVIMSPQGGNDGELHENVKKTILEGLMNGTILVEDLRNVCIALSRGDDQEALSSWTGPSRMPTIKKAFKAWATSSVPTQFREIEPTIWSERMSRELETQFTPLIKPTSYWTTEADKIFKEFNITEEIKRKIRQHVIELLKYNTPITDIKSILSSKIAPYSKVL